MPALDNQRPIDVIKRGECEAVKRVIAGTEGTIAS
ncbi:MAG: hypothetical protein JJE13_04305 [Thermoleophilia bacterium]|nr:hypothetical protein [Thermoleophilia bacterium]